VSFVEDVHPRSRPLSLGQRVDRADLNLSAGKEPIVIGLDYPMIDTIPKESSSAPDDRTSEDEAKTYKYRKEYFEHPQVKKIL
jgi:hypothetical protein